jgi:5'-3' exonuclease
VAGYDHVAVCLDSQPYRRSEVFGEYKAGRESLSPQAMEQFQRVKERLIADGLLLWSAPGLEADDVIATAVTMARGHDLETTIASSDKDLMILVSDADHVRQLSFATGAVFDEEAVRLKFGVLPSGMRDLLALTGDKSDNVPGVTGVGEKTAALVVNSPAGLDGALRGEPVKGLTPRLADLIADNRETVLLARKLIQLDTTAPINFSDVFNRREPRPLTTTTTGFDEADFEDAPPSEPRAAAPVASNDVQPKTSKTELKSAPVTVEQVVEAGRKAAAPETMRQPAPDAIVLRPEPPKEWALQLEPGTTRDAWTMAKTLHDSRLFTQFNNAQAIFAVILRGRSLGIDAVTSLANFHIIEGRATMHAALIVGLILKSGKAEYFDLAETSDEKATWVTKRKGSTRETVMTWTVADALNAGMLVGTPDDARGVSKSGKPSNWDKYRPAMLRWRAATELARAVYPDVTTGLYTPDEISEGVHDPEIEERHSAAE